jgi:hypothetical protein
MIKRIVNNTGCFIRLLSSSRFLSLAAALCLLTAATTTFADDAESTSSEFSAEVKAGGRYADTDGDRTFLAPYDPFSSSPVFGFDLFNLSPDMGTFRVEADYLHSDDWDAGVKYNYGAGVAVEGRSREFRHNLEHRPPAPPSTSVHATPDDLDPGGEYFSNFREDTASLRVRVPGYPAHLKASGRIYTQKGPRQMIYLDENCTSNCHVVSRRRDLDMETKEYTLGFDGHFGPVDIAYDRNFLTFEDQAPDPMDRYEIHVFPFRRPGSYVHDVNPELKSVTDTLRINSNLTNRAVASLSYSNGDSENLDSDITRGHQRLNADLSYLFSPRHLLSFRYVYDSEATDDISEGARAIREEIGNAEEPAERENAGEVTYRYSLARKLQLRATVRYGLIKRDETETSGLPEETRTTAADLYGDYRLTQTLQLKASVGNKWTSDPAFATDTTSLLRFALKAFWAPSSIWSLQALYDGYRGENDDRSSLTAARGEHDVDPADLKRDTGGDSFTALATVTPSEAVSLTAAYTYTRNDVEMDLLFGSLGAPGYHFESRNTPWESTSHVANIEGVWAASKQLVLSAGCMFLTGEESYTPAFSGSEGLSEIAAVEFTKIMASLGAEYAFTESTVFSLEGLWIDFNDEVDDRGDGSGQSLVASISRKW